MPGRIAGVYRLRRDFNRDEVYPICRRSCRDVIDQPRLTEASRDEEAERAVLCGLDAAQGVRVAHLEIIDRKPGRFDRKPSFAHDPRDRLAPRDPRCALPSRTVE